MRDIIVKDRLGNDEFFAGVAGIRVQSTDGNKVSFVLEPGKYVEYTFNDSGEIVEAIVHGFDRIPTGCFAYLYYMESVDFSFSPNLTDIGERAFYDCRKLSNITLPDGLKSIGTYAFYNCAMENAIIPEGVTTIGANAFQSCKSLKRAVIPRSMTHTGNSTFYYCSGLESVILPDTLTAIGNQTFGYCEKINNITIPASVTNIGQNAFNGCNSLYSATFEDTSGWYVSTTQNATYGTNLTVTDKNTAAIYLRSTYKTYFWFNKT